MGYDDGFSAWLDGTALADQNAGAPVAESAEAAFVLNLQGLAAGPHVLAIQGDNVATDDGDFLLAPRLVAQWFTQGEPGYFAVATPGEPNGPAGNGPRGTPDFAPPRGFYSEAQTVTVTGPTGATLWYTTDGRQPGVGVGTAVLPASEAERAVFDARARAPDRGRRAHAPGPAPTATPLAPTRFGARCSPNRLAGATPTGPPPTRATSNGWRNTQGYKLHIFRTEHSI